MGIKNKEVKAGIMTGLLVFYVLYTMWWGFAIFYLFEGVGLTMKKAKIKKVGRLFNNKGYFLSLSRKYPSLAKRG
jgi:hypothetical protein